MNQRTKLKVAILNILIDSLINSFIHFLLQSPESNWMATKSNQFVVHLHLVLFFYRFTREFFLTFFLYVIHTFSYSILCVGWITWVTFVRKINQVCLHINLVKDIVYKNKNDHHLFCSKITGIGQIGWLFNRFIIQLIGSQEFKSWQLATTITKYGYDFIQSTI